MLERPICKTFVTFKQQNATNNGLEMAFVIDSPDYPGKKIAVSSFVDCEHPMIRLKADILDMMSEALASATFLRSGTKTAATTTFKHTTKTTKTTA